ncbi:mttA/Hcf106 family-domain-containing protein [Dunaliella salina]|uniref:MttA/Hcf106 family-domain-containing protein n=1 Tax=Dunaliella salina TaxID=3046 RepID=A0ABQ7GHH9_DUNSA|nr:mttA/Hcf106 family-domain-containing protein [Dunaliella salina]|eukprot:KAF5834065.1 mttA/Hcf106 family-domain-containing protein [Dunaliella salina]
MQCLTQRTSSCSATSTSSRSSTRQLALPSTSFTTLRRSSSSTLQHRQSSPLFRSRDSLQLPGRAPVVCQGLFGLGLPELAVIAGIAAVVFGPSKLPELGSGLGKTVKSFQTAAKEFEQELKQASKDDDAASAEATCTSASWRREEEGALCMNAPAAGHVGHLGRRGV